MRRALAQHSTLPGVRALRVLADDDELVVRPDERALVDVQVEGEAQLEQKAPLDDTGRHLWSPDGAEEDGIEAAQLLERRFGQNLAVAEVALAAEVELDGVELDARRVEDAQCLGDDLGPDPVTADHGDAVRAVTSTRSHRARTYRRGADDR